MSFFSKLLNRDALHNLQEALANLGFLADAEKQIAEFYLRCAGVMPNEAAFWNAMAREELRHAENAERMSERITREPKYFKPGISFSTVTIRIFAMETQRLVEQMNAGSIPQNELFAAALEIENSIVETCYGKMVKTEDGIFNMLAHQNDDESVKHQSAIISKMNGL